MIKRFTRRAPGWRAGTFAALTAGWVWIAMSNVQTAPQAAAPAQTPGATGAAAPTHRQALNRYCVSCHNKKLKSGGVALDKLDPATPTIGTDVWERVIRKLNTGTMPPGGRPRPDQATYDSITNWLEGEIDRAAAGESESGPHQSGPSPEPRRVSERHPRPARARHRRRVAAAGRRTRRTAASTTTPTSCRCRLAQLERYLSAARQISRLAVGHPAHRSGGRDLRTPVSPEPGRSHERRSAARLPRRHRRSPLLPGRRRVSVKVLLRRTYVDYIQGMGTPHQLDVRHRRRAGQALHRRRRYDGEAAPDSFAGAGGVWGDPEWEDYVLQADKGLELRLPVKAGPHVIGVSFVRKMREPEGILQGARAAACCRTPRSTTATPPWNGRNRRPVQLDRPRRHAEPAPDFRVSARQRGAEEEACATQNSLAPRAPRLPPARHAAGRRDAARVLQGGPERGRQLRRGRAVRARTTARRSRFPAARRARSRRRRQPASLPTQRSRTGVAAVVLPLEQHSRRCRCSTRPSARR